MEGITLGIVLGVGASMLARRGRGTAKAAIGWVARQSGWIAERVRSDVESARRAARESLERERLKPPRDASSVDVASHGGRV